MKLTQNHFKTGDRAEEYQEHIFEVGDRVEIAGLSKHEGEIVAVKNNRYSGLTYSVRVGGKRLEGINPLALSPC